MVDILERGQKIKIKTVSIEEGKRLRQESNERLQNRPTPTYRKKNKSSKSPNIFVEFKCNLCEKPYKKNGKNIEKAKTLEMSHLDVFPKDNCNGTFKYSRQIDVPCSNCGSYNWDIVPYGRIRCITCGEVDTDKLKTLFQCTKCNQPFEKEFESLSELMSFTGVEKLEEIKNYKSLHKSTGCGGDVKFIKLVCKNLIKKKGDIMYKKAIGIPKGETENVIKVCNDIKSKHSDFDYAIIEPSSDVPDSEGRTLKDKFEKMLIIKSDSERKVDGWRIWFLTRCKNAKLGDDRTRSTLMRKSNKNTNEEVTQ